MSKLLVVDDEPIICHSFRRVFAGRGVDVLTAGTVAEGWRRFENDRPDIVVLDLQLPDGSGLDLFRRIAAEDPRRPVIMITAHGTTDTAIEAMKNGAFDYLLKPLDLEKITAILDRAFEAARLMQVPAALPDEPSADRIVGRSAVIQEMCKLIGRVAPQDVNVLILGESGVGKELVARAIYQHSRRADRRFLAINCAALPESLIESELFGHEKGAFTGAERQRIGKFEQANGGTIFLDEVGDMPAAAQAKMLRLLQDQTFERVGGNETISTQVRVLAATNKDLPRLIEEGKFRADLYYRLKVMAIQVPPLRDRLEDVPELAHHFLYRYDRELGLDVRGFTPETLELIQRYTWPGNVRELQGAVKAAILRATGRMVLPEFLPPTVRGAAGVPEVVPHSAQGPNLAALIESCLQDGQGNVYDRVLAEVERELLTQTLRHTRGHQANASEVLGINRTTLRNKLRDLGIGVDRVVADRAETEE